LTFFKKGSMNYRPQQQQKAMVLGDRADLKGPALQWQVSVGRIRETVKDRKAPTPDPARLPDRVQLRLQLDRKWIQVHRNPIHWASPNCRRSLRPLRLLRQLDLAALRP
jgi:hypothetical protein